MRWRGSLFWRRGGIVLRQEKTPLVAVVRLRKRNEWVLPKGKLDDGETPRDAAEREVLEETGHDVSVHEFLGTLVYESGGRSKVVHYWRMETRGEQVHELMDDVRAVEWLPLDAAVERLSRAYERVFLANVGPLALEAAALARLQRRVGAKQPVPEKRRPRRVVAPPPSPAPPPDLTSALTPLAIPDESPLAGSDVIAAETSVGPAELTTATRLAVALDSTVEVEAAGDDRVRTPEVQRRNLVQKMRDWLRRAA